MLRRRCTYTMAPPREQVCTTSFWSVHFHNNNTLVLRYFVMIIVIVMVIIIIIIIIIFQSSFAYLSKIKNVTNVIKYVSQYFPYFHICRITDFALLLPIVGHFHATQTWNSLCRPHQRIMYSRSTTASLSGFHLKGAQCAFPVHLFWHGISSGVVEHAFRLPVPTNLHTWCTLTDITDWMSDMSGREVLGF